METEIERNKRCFARKKLLWRKIEILRDLRVRERGNIEKLKN